MGSNRRRFLELIATASVISVAGCSSGGDNNSENDGNSDDSGDGAESDDDDGGTSDDNGGADSGEDDDESETSDGGDDDSGTDGSSDDGSGGDTDEGDTENDEQIQPADITGTAESSVAELEVVSHEVTAFDLQVRIELELRNAGDEDNIALTHHNIDSALFNADGNNILREQSGTRGPESSPPPGESRVVEIFILPERGTEPASYEITVNCDGLEYSDFTYCKSE